MLTWWPELGYGHYPVPQDDRPYDASYFDKYRVYAGTPLGKALTAARVELVNKYFTGGVVDVGIGSGQFVEAVHGFGYDVNPAGIAWLKERDLYVDVYSTEVNAMSFWDSLEHIDDMERIIKRVYKYAFVSIPIFKDAESVLTSKHFRKDEHIWYFTIHGLIGWFEKQGFVLREHNNMESELGREGIGTFVFERKPA